MKQIKKAFTVAFERILGKRCVTLRKNSMMVVSVYVGPSASEISISILLVQFADLADAMNDFCEFPAAA